MHIELTSESLLVQLGYTPNDATQKQMDKIIANTNGFDKFSKHLLSLTDHIKHTNSYIAMSNTNDYLKIKSESPSSELLNEFHTIVSDWATKYNIKLEKIKNKEVYYILGSN